MAATPFIPRYILPHNRSKIGRRDFFHLFGATYTYDPNDLDLTYNHLNLIEKVARDGTVLAKYSYLADGTKLSATDADGNGLVYAGSLVYRKQNSVMSLESGAFPEGRFIATDSGIETHYHLTDHLGSVRATVQVGLDGDGFVYEQLHEVNNFYPFGMRWQDPNQPVSDNRYRYNSKEEQNFLDLPFSDYGARQYDAKLGRWFGHDPLSHVRPWETPYGFCNNNPIRYFDPTGMMWLDPQEAERLKNAIDNRIASLNKSLSDLQTKLQDDKLSDKKKTKLGQQISEAQDRISNLETGVANIDALGADQNNTYAFTRIDGGNHNVIKDQDGVVHIQTSSDAISIHEITHVKQSLDAGGLRFYEGKLLNTAVNIDAKTGDKTANMETYSNNEINAYRMQYSYDPRSFPGYTGGKGLQGIDVHSVGNIRNDRGGLVYEDIYNYVPKVKAFYDQQKKLGLK